MLVYSLVLSVCGMQEDGDFKCKRSTLASGLTAERCEGMKDSLRVSFEDKELIVVKVCKVKKEKEKRS